MVGEEIQSTRYKNSINYVTVIHSYFVAPVLTEVVHLLS